MFLSANVVATCFPEKRREFSILKCVLETSMVGGAGTSRRKTVGTMSVVVVQDVREPLAVAHRRHDSWTMLPLHNDGVFTIYKCPRISGCGRFFARKFLGNILDGEKIRYIPQSIYIYSEYI